jgi:hypothetical protein
MFNSSMIGIDHYLLLFPDPDVPQIAYDFPGNMLKLIPLSARVSGRVG